MREYASMTSSYNLIFTEPNYSLANIFHIFTCTSDNHIAFSCLY